MLILDEPTSVLTPDEADEVLGMVRAMCLRGELSALIITHKFREVQAFCDEVTVLRHGRLTGEGRVCDLTPAAMGEMMMGTAVIPAPSARIGDLSGGNVQRAVLARELGEDVEVLVVANPWFGLDFKAVAEIRSRIMQARNRGAAVLLVSEDLDEILELADRVLVISAGKIVHEEPVQGAERHVIGRYMAGH